jgi:hypothetical protein
MKMKKQFVVFISLFLLIATLTGCNNDFSSQTNEQYTNGEPTPQYEVGTVMIISNGVEYEPFTHKFFSNRFFHGGIISAEMPPLSWEEASESLTEIVYSDNLIIDITGNYATRIRYSLYDDNFNNIYMYEENFIPPTEAGVYMLRVMVIWTNMEIEQHSREGSGMNYIFKIKR